MTQTMIREIALISLSVCVLLGAAAVNPITAAGVSQGDVVSNEGVVASEGEGNEADLRAAALARDWGIDIVGLRSSAMGYMLDFRYTVLDEAKAARLFGPKIRPELIDPESGMVLKVPSPPTVGALRQTRNKSNVTAGRQYFILFSNPGGVMQPGKKVQIKIGELRIDDVLIQ